MNVKIAKEFKWSMSHRLPFHKGVCSNIHGHAYKIRVIIGGEVDENGMLIDFFELDSAVKPIISSLDHAFLCDEKDVKLLDFIKENGFKHCVMPQTTTAENVGYYILNQLAESFTEFGNLDYLAIRFYETDDAYAELEMALK